MSSIISAKNDVIFKKLFADSNNKELLISFLSAALDIPQESITDVTVKNPELPPNLSDGKLSRLDILLSTHDRNINIEMQNIKTTDYRERVLFYWSKMYSEPLRSGQKYSELNQSISMNILSYNMFDCEEYTSAFAIYENTRHELFSDKLQLYFFELPKVGHSPDTTDMRKLWLQVINADSEEELTMLTNTQIPAIQQGVKSIMTLNSDDSIRALAWEREKTERDYYSDMANAEARGRAEERNAIIKKLRAKGLTDQEIAEWLS